jgi:hypothetical protein
VYAVSVGISVLIDLLGAIIVYLVQSDPTLRDVRSKYAKASQGKGKDCVCYARRCQLVDRAAYSERT